MSGQLQNRIVQLLIRWVFIVVPTIVIGYITLVYLNFSYTAHTASIGIQATYFGIGILIAYSLYFFRARWIVTFILLWIVYWIIGKIIVKLPGEFDVFYVTAKFQLYSALFLFGWLFGFLLARVKYSYIIISGILIVSTLIVISSTIDVSLNYILAHLAPVVIYGLYMLFLSPLLTDQIEMDLKKSGRLLLRFSIFLLLVILAFVFVESLFRSDLKAVEKELAARGAKEKKDDKDGGYDQRHGLMDKPGGDDDGFKLKDTMRVDSKMSQSDRLMFCAKLDNYFPDGSPQPLYFVYHYLTKYDPARESFIRDTNVPSFDEFDADPSELPMYHLKEDTSVIRKSMATKLRKTVSAEVYLSSNTWKHSLLAPATAFSLQAIPVEKDFQKTFFSAYKVKSYVSELNNAYFVYNISANPQLERIQVERNFALETVKNYDKVDKQFYDYYTQMPKGVIYDSIEDLAKKAIAGKTLPIDKVLAIRDIFLQRGSDGKRIYKYTLKPGGVSDPNIPNASMLGNFLFKTHAGYCTYYAGASLFLLRSLGIPARFTTGFATVNRSDKNKGWYWFYASQAHAWTQVYFPGYGWMDFDMTIGNEGQQEAPKPDGTPPLPPPEPWLVVNAIAASAPDTVKKTVNVSFDHIIYFNDEYSLKRSFDRPVDASLRRVMYDKKDTTLSAIHAGDSIIVVSYFDDVKRIPKPQKGVAIENQVAAFPSPIVADEIHIKPKKKVTKEDDKKKKEKKIEEKKMTWQEMLVLAGEIVGGIIVLMLLLPLLYLLFLLLRGMFAGDANKKADRIYQTALYRLHMAGLERENETPMEYARTKVDPKLHAGFQEFMNVYLRLKYGKGTLREGDAEIIDRFAKNYGPAIFRSTGFFKTSFNYFNVLLASRYFLQSDNNEYDNQSPTL